MAHITLFKPDKPQGEKYPNATSISIQYGVLTFYHQSNLSSQPHNKLTTSLPFLIEEEMSH
jgi:hypothetical protein